MKSNSQRCWQRLDNYATKDVLVLSLCFLLLFTAYNGLQYLQSSLHTEAGLGLATISVLYGSLAAANLMGLASVGISQIGHKWTMVVCMSTYLMWVLMNGHATWYTMIPSAVLVGLGAGPLWVAAAAYLTVTASSVACKGREQMQVIIHRYFGILYFMFSLGGLIGPAISAAILHVKDEGRAVYNSSYAATLWTKCGARDCPGNPLNETAIEPQNPDKVWLLVGVYGGCALLAVLTMALALDNIPKLARPFTIAQIVKMTSSVIRQHRHLRQILLLPLFIQQGWALGFVYGELTKSFGSCVYGVWMVGVITLPFGLAQSIMALAAGGMVKYIGRLVMMTSALVVNVAVLITLLYWNGEGGQYVVYTFSCLLGIADAIKRNISNGTLACLFPDNSDTAFCATNFWEAVAWILPFAYSNYLCTSTKIWVLSAITVLAICSFMALEKPCCRQKDSYGTVARNETEADQKQNECNTDV